MPTIKSKPRNKKKKGLDVEEPKQYKVIMLNDNYTPMGFVVEILVSIFGKPTGEAKKIMLTIHNKGSAVCGIYPYDIALVKIEIVHRISRDNGYPLKCIAEPE
jgi:ATP-dependent Clp protease adaptor protein ClpS